ncbi:MAG: hypothetical protein VX466_03025 [Myxococcota bacterium]|nr:hypothetical protein [Myxococcota bacterium]
MRAASRIAAACVAALILAACDRPSPSTDRLASRYQGGKRTWVSESSLSKEPQKKPRMVIYEVTSYPEGSRPSAEQNRASEDLVERCFEAAKRHGWFQFKNALDQGYALLFGDRRHYVKPEYVFDEVSLDCDRPEFLMYYDTPDGKGLAGVMFYVERPTAWGPQIGGPLTVWHYHVWAPIQCLQGEMLLVGAADEQGRCRKGVPMQRSPEMLHVWFIDRPKGPFTSSMYLADDEIARLMEPRKAPPLRIEASLGLSP